MAYAVDGRINAVNNKTASEIHNKLDAMEGKIDAVDDKIDAVGDKTAWSENATSEVCDKLGGVAFTCGETSSDLVDAAAATAVLSEQHNNLTDLHKGLKAKRKCAMECD